MLEKTMIGDNEVLVLPEGTPVLMKHISRVKVTVAKENATIVMEFDSPEINISKFSREYELSRDFSESCAAMGFNIDHIYALHRNPWESSTTLYLWGYD